MFPEKGLYHTAYSVPDLDAAKRQLGQAFGLTWTQSLSTEVQIRAAGGEQHAITVQFSYSLQGPPYIELIQGPPGDPYFGAEAGGHIHHVGLFVDDLQTAIDEYEALGLPMSFATVDAQGNPSGLSFHRNPYGANVELVSPETRAGVQAMIQAQGGEA